MMDDNPTTHTHHSGGYVLGSFLLLAGFSITVFCLVEILGNGISWSATLAGLLLGVVSLLIGWSHVRQALHRK